MKTEELIIYRDLKHKDLLNQISKLLAPAPADEPGAMPDSCACAGRLIELAVTYGFEGNLWHCFLAFCLANNENAYSVSCERRGTVEGSLRALADHDFAVIRQLFDCDLRVLDKAAPGKIWEELSCYRSGGRESRVFNRRIRDQIVALAVELEKAESTEAFGEAVTDFYRRFGVGKWGLNKAFRIREAREAVFVDPIINVEHVHLSDLIGYELQKEKLIANTEAFVHGKAANNVLLYGDSGTGKSSSIKAILNEFYDQGLRMIEVYKHQFKGLSTLLEQIKDRNYRFIIYMDDLSFEEFELEYKYLKAIIEGGLGKKPTNVLIYATSNRRHLIREKFSDKQENDDELHTRDTVQEKLSLVARFGVTIYYGSPDQTEFRKIVRELAKRYEIDMPEEKLFLEAGKWELSHGGLSGRTASQFITHLLGGMEG